MADNIVTEKLCLTCDTLLPSAAFYRLKRGGLYYQCRGCQKLSRTPQRPKDYIIVDVKSCLICKVEKPAREFYADASRKDRLSPYCKPCTLHKQKGYMSQPQVRARRKLYAQAHSRLKANRDSVKRRREAVMQDPARREAILAERRAAYRERNERTRAQCQASNLAKWGITVEEYKRMEEAQGGACAICKRPNPQNRALSVDHCHATGAIRALLCDPCNKELGFFNDDPSRLCAAMNYLLHFENSLYNPR